MSERGSFVTEFIYCTGCLERMQAVLVGNIKHGPHGKYLIGERVSSIDRVTGKLWSMNIIAGKLGGCAPGDDLIMFQFELFTAENAPCHPVRVALLPDSGAGQIVRVMPDGEVELHRYVDEEERQ
jgi:hypothetical protein